MDNSALNSALDRAIRLFPVRSFYKMASSAWQAVQHQKQGFHGLTWCVLQGGRQAVGRSCSSANMRSDWSWEKASSEYIDIYNAISSY